MPQQSAASDGYSHHHAVKFYGSDQSLFATVASFLSDALTVEAPAILIATDAHRSGILEHLETARVDVVRARRNGDLVILDADETLGLFLIEQTPHQELFEQHVGRLIDQALRGRTRTVVRVYGEMVDVLWRQGHADAAIALELLWNKLALTDRFSLLCGYSMGQFYKQPAQYQDVCRQHTHVLGPDTNVVPFSQKCAARSS
jgi:hypothetical protein